MRKQFFVSLSTGCRCICSFRCHWSPLFILSHCVRFCLNDNFFHPPPPLPLASCIWGWCEVCFPRTMVENCIKYSHMGNDPSLFARNWCYICEFSGIESMQDWINSSHHNLFPFLIDERTEGKSGPKNAANVSSSTSSLSSSSSSHVQPENHHCICCIHFESNHIPIHRITHNKPEMISDMRNQNCVACFGLNTN